jgi:hypothetical protein
MELDDVMDDVTHEEMEISFRTSPRARACEGQAARNPWTHIRATGHALGKSVPLRVTTEDEQKARSEMTTKQRRRDDEKRKKSAVDHQLSEVRCTRHTRLTVSCMSSPRRSSWIWRRTS